MSDMTTKRRGKTPPKIDPKDWRERIPAHLLAEAEAEGPLDLGDTHTETAEQAAERIQRAAQARAARWLEQMPAMYAEAALDDLAAVTERPIRKWLQADGTTLIL